MLRHILVISAIIMVVSGCAGQKVDDGRTRVHYWYVSGANDQVPASVTLFNASQDSIEVVPVAIPWKEHEKKVLTAVLSGNPPDLINLVTPISKWASRMALIPLDSLFESSKLNSEAFFDANWDDVTHQGQLYGMPMHTASYAFFYNKDHFREVGLDPDQPPRTWDELAAMAKRLDRVDARGRISRLGFLPDYGNLSTPMLMAWQSGAELLKGDTLVDMTDPALIHALEWVGRFYEDYSFDNILSFRAGLGIADQHGFISGKVSMMVLDNTFLDQLARYGPSVDYGVAMIPTWPGRPTAGSTGTWWVGIPRGAKEVEAAWAFLSFATGAECQKAESMTMTENLFPANHFALTDSTFLAVHPARRTFVEMLEFAVTPSVVPMAHDVFWREFGWARDQVFYGRKSPQEAFADASRRVQQELDEALGYDRYVRAQLASSGGRP